MGDQIEMSTAENIFGSVSKFLTPQTSPRPTFSFNIELWEEHLILHGHLLI